MSDYLVQFAVGNFCLSLGLAVVAWAVHRTGRWPHLAHVLWLLVLAKLVTPPVFFIPIDGVSGAVVSQAGALAGHLGFAPEAAGVIRGQGHEAGAAAAEASALTPAVLWTVEMVLLLVWGLGSAAVLGWLLWHGCRFNRLLRLASAPAPSALQRDAAAVAGRLGLRARPRLYVTPARLSPMVWSWPGLGCCVLLPRWLTREVGADRLRWVLAHELAHLRRGDHLVRWLECLTCVLFWWNPVTWWARRNLRLAEEICCDALVLESLGPDRRAYAETLMAVIEALASAPRRPPLLASEMGSGGILERRLLMIMSTETRPKSSRALRALLVTSCLVMPLGVSSAEEHAAESKATLPAIGTTVTGTWHAVSRTATAITGDIQISDSAIAFANGEGIPITPASPGARNVFAVEPAADPELLNGNRLCGSPVTYVMLLPYGDFALAMHVYDDRLAPEDPSPEKLSELARQGKCASYYYRLNS